jgi:hypothetical protein
LLGNQYSLGAWNFVFELMSVGSKLSVKERIGYEVFFFTAVYGLYNVFFSNSVVVDAGVFTLLFGSLFVRYHLVVSDKDLKESSAARWTGTAMFTGSVVITSHFVFERLKAVTAGFGTFWEPYLVLVGGAVSGAMLFAVFNHQVFRYDEQRLDTFKEKAKTEDGPLKYVARTALFFEKQAEKGNYEFDVDESVGFEESKRLMRKMREGEITPEERSQLKQGLKRQRDITAILVVGFHALVSVILLLVSVLVAEVFTSLESVEMLGLSLMVTGVYYSFLMLHTRFGLRKEVSRRLRTMPAELVLCILATFGTVYNSGLIAGTAVLVLVPFFGYLMSSWGVSFSGRLFAGFANVFVETSDDEYSELMKEVMQEGGSN